MCTKDHPKVVAIGVVKEPRTPLFPAYRLPHKAYDERQPLDAKYPSILPSEAELDPEARKESLKELTEGEQNGVKYDCSDQEFIELLHAPPGLAFPTKQYRFGTS